jgi:PAS domain S-box-containing protein
MKSKQAPEPESAKLRRRAEKRVAEHARTAASRGSTETQRLIQELEVHQVELELQNEELRKARAELEANYNELYDFAPVGYFTLKRNGQIEKTNLTGSVMLGQPRADLLGRRLASFVTPESLANFNNFLRRVMGGSDKEGCKVTLMKGGTTPIVAYVEGIGTDPRSKRRVVVVDITSIEQSRRALRESEARLKLALTASGMGVWEWEWEGDSGNIYWSPECFRILGIERVSPTLGTLTQLLHPEDAPRVRTTVSEALADGKEQAVECRVRRPDGEVIWVLVRGQVQYGRAGKPLRLIGILQDITERKKTEARTGRPG